MASSFVLRCKTRSAAFTINNFTAASTLASFKMHLEGITGIKAHMMKILCGFPPKALPPSSGDSSTLGELGIQSGDSLIVETLEVAEESAIKGDGHPNIVRIQAEQDAESFECKAKENPELRTMAVKQIKADNSCLFASIYYAIMDHKSDNNDDCQVLRQTCAEAVAQNPSKYNAAFLGKPNEEYCEWICHRDTWGGGIELSLLSEFFQVEIVVIHTQNASAHRFGEEMNYSNRVFLIYDGVHYEPLYMKTNGSVETTFETKDSVPFDMALKIGKEAKSKKQFTDLSNFAVKCQQCGAIFVGSKQVSDHAKLTGHNQFGEVK